MERNKRLLKALLELTITLGVEALSAKRQALYLRALANWSVDDLEFACQRAGEACRFMPVPAEIIDFARQAPRKQQIGNLYRTALDHTTSYNERLAEEAFKAIEELGFEFKPVVSVPGSKRPVYSL
jgi:hypothetical protein